MRKKIVFVLSTLIVFIAYNYLNKKDVSVSQVDAPQVKTKTTSKVSKTAKTSNLQNGAIKKINAQNINSQNKAGSTTFFEDIKQDEKESFKYFFETFKLALNDSKDVDIIFERLASKNLLPYKSEDSNPYTGTMSIIRTKKAIAGARYFHAQYLGDGKGPASLQHMSFEFRPGPKAFAFATNFVKKNFSIGIPNETIPEKFISWHIKDNYLLWIKKLEESDLKNDPHNAYAPSDVGTIKVVIEKEIH